MKNHPYILKQAQEYAETITYDTNLQVQLIEAFCKGYHHSNADNFLHTGSCLIHDDFSDFVTYVEIETNQTNESTN